VTVAASTASLEAKVLRGEKRTILLNATINVPMDENYTMRERMSGAINALSIAPDGNAVVVAGRESN
jgi:hypothetical protein